MARATLGAAIRARRQQRGLSQRQLGRLAGLTGAYISRLENDQYASPGSVELSAVATALGVSVYDLLPDGEPRTTIEVAADKAQTLSLLARFSTPILEVLERTGDLMARRLGAVGWLTAAELAALERAQVEQVPDARHGQQEAPREEQNERAEGHQDELPPGGRQPNHGGAPA